ncbi:MAG: hypothetical protein JW902_07750, partial [Syntrophaceae bacterium]|nr:hypothetical protein [Syntrophaceae bacterium]
MYIIGIDIGTTNSKVVLYDTHGTLQALHAEPTIGHEDGPGMVHYNPCEIWAAVCKGIKAVLSSINDSSKVAGISACSMGEALVGIDGSGRETGWSFPWNDQRMRQAGPWWRNHFSDEEIYIATGEPALFKNGINHLLYIRNNMPDVFKRVKKWLHLADFVTYKLSGEAVSNFPIVGGSMMYHNERKDWWAEMLTAGDIPRDVLTRLADSGTLLGPVCKAAQKETGLTADTKVAVGGHDHITAALACHIVRSGDTINSMGTAETIMRVTDKLLDGGDVMKTGLLQHHHVVKGKYYLSCSLPNGSGTISWAFHNLGCSDNFQDNVVEAMKAKAGCGGVLFLPHLLGSGSPSNDDLARGALIGLRTGSVKADMLRSIHEGLIYEFRMALEVMDDFVKSSSGKMVGVSGGFRNELIRRLKADMTGLEFMLPKIEEASTLGAAML